MGPFSAGARRIGGGNFEAYTLLAAIAVLTSRVELGVMVSCNSFRNLNLLADMIRTIDHISGGEKVTLRLVAQYADQWNFLGDPAVIQSRNTLLDGYCAEIGRDPAEIERTVLLEDKQLEKLEAYVEVGLTHLILGSGDPWNFKGLEKLVSWRDHQ